MAPLKDLTGQRFGVLAVLSRKEGAPRTTWSPLSPLYERPRPGRLFIIFFKKFFQKPLDLLANLCYN